MSTLTYEQAAQRLLEGDGYLILTHVRPDGDTVGCAAALCTALREQGKEPGAHRHFCPLSGGPAGS